GSRRFISGVVEGFYGRPWSMEQRTELFKREQSWGLNTYLYAPKDDSKHRMFWRNLYTAEEAEQLTALIAAAQQHHVDFIYAISPGLDMTFSSPREVSALKRKLEQVKQFGCRSFSLLFDDIEREMCPADKRAFGSFAHAQVAVANAVYQHLGEPHTFLFCPTDYCAAFCSPSVSQSAYLQTLGEQLLPGMDVLWTGPKVVSHKISVESIEEVSSVLRRAPVLWDNIHANDYDPQRLFLGPYKDRPTELISRLRGVLTNPNCEFHPNFVAVHTLASWCRAPTGGEQRDVEMGEPIYLPVSTQFLLRSVLIGCEEEQDPCYSPQKALGLALADWFQEFLLPDHPGGRGGAAAGLREATPPGSRPPGGLKKESWEEEPMQTEVESAYAPGVEEKPRWAAEPLTLDDLKLLAELFYLPYEHGPTARTMLQELHWLKAHSPEEVGLPFRRGLRQQEAAWRSRALRFDQMCEAVVQMFNRLCNAPNRSVVYDLYSYVCDIKSGVCLARAYVKTLGGHHQPPAQPGDPDPEAWTLRGGLSGEFQRMLPAHGEGDLFPQPPRTRIYCIRPYCPEDQGGAKLPRRSSASGKEPGGVQPVLVADCGCLPSLLSGELQPSPASALVLEDDAGVCGCALALIDAKEAADKCQRAVGFGSAHTCSLTAPVEPVSPGPEHHWGVNRSASVHQRAVSPSVLEEFPSLVTVQLLPRVTDSSPAQRMMSQLLSSIRKAGSKGAFCELRRADQRMLDFYTQLGCFNRVSTGEDLVVMGTSL
uniref:protein O-GlcNAcase n=1 Tax=Tetraodon nigroviridis TaxID=99883 RepID=H3DJH2_TETNG